MIIESHSLWLTVLACLRKNRSVQKAERAILHTPVERGARKCAAPVCSEGTAPAPLAVPLLERCSRIDKHAQNRRVRHPAGICAFNRDPSARGRRGRRTSGGGSWRHSCAMGTHTRDAAHRTRTARGVLALSLWPPTRGHCPPVPTRVVR